MSALFAARLRALRKVRGLTQEQASSLIGCDYKYYQRLEAGKDVRLSTLAKIATALGVDPSELLKTEESTEAEVDFQI
ncbi:MAG: helix-turn-helix transcriptional regulator [Verrucomicrobiota bacterium]